jgi:uncharacterized membrane protein YcaP (DUF421 family)
MKKEDIEITDIVRILFGPVPPEFYIEMVIRALFVYLVITFGMKYMGKRISSQMSRSELAAMATLAAATGLVIMDPQRGLLPPLIVLGVILFIKWIVDKGNYRSERLEFITEGHYSTLIEDGVLNTHEMKKVRLSKEQLFAQLRGLNIIHLGTIKRLYMEANGAFSIVKSNEKKPGLPVIPPEDTAFINEFNRSDRKACKHCGHLQRQGENNCSNCGSAEWTESISTE